MAHARTRLAELGHDRVDRELDEVREMTNLDARERLCARARVRVCREVAAWARACVLWGARRQLPTSPVETVVVGARDARSDGVIDGDAGAAAVRLIEQLVNHTCSFTRHTRTAHARTDQPRQVLLQQRVVERRQVRVHDGVVGELALKLIEWLVWLVG